MPPCKALWLESGARLWLESGARTARDADSRDGGRVEIATRTNATHATPERFEIGVRVPGGYREAERFGSGSGGVTAMPRNVPAFVIAYAREPNPAGVCAKPLPRSIPSITLPSRGDIKNSP